MIAGRCDPLRFKLLTAAALATVVAVCLSAPARAATADVPVGRVPVAATAEPKSVAGPKSSDPAASAAEPRTPGAVTIDAKTPVRGPTPSIEPRPPESAAAPVGDPNALPMLTPWSLLTATAGLIAFLIGLFTLVGRERKSPYITNTIYPVFLLCLLTAAVALASTLTPRWLEQPVLRCSSALLLLAFGVSAAKVYRIAVRSIYFVDTVGPKNWPVVRDLRRRRALRNRRHNYAHNTVPISPEVKAKIIGILRQVDAHAFENREDLDPQALALAVQHQGQGNRILAQLAETFLLAGYSIQYLAASRHPIEFVGYLKRHVEALGYQWETLSNRIVVIDAYSPHFGFLDSIYPKKDQELDSLDVAAIKSKMTFAGMHTASSRAFNTLKEQIAEPKRNPTLVIYEDSYALADLESPEQYRIFVRHVMPSERMWDGMFTVFAESAMPDADWKMLQACASMRLDLRARARTPGNDAAPPTATTAPMQNALSPGAVSGVGLSIPEEKA